MEQKLKSATDHKAKMEQQYQRALHSMKSKGALIEAAVWLHLYRHECINVVPKYKKLTVLHTFLDNLGRRWR